VYVEEVSYRSKSIEGVGTSVAGIVGPTRYGPTKGKPEVVTSMTEFSRIYGDLNDLSLDGTEHLNFTALGAKAFFEGGGKQLYVSRASQFSSPTDGIAFKSDTNDHVTFKSRFPGAFGNLVLEVNWRDSENLIQSTVTSTPASSDIVFLEATGITQDQVAKTLDPLEFEFPLSIKALVQLGTTHFTIVDDFVVATDLNGTTMSATDFDFVDGDFVAAQMISSGSVSIKFTKVIAKQPTSGEITAGTTATLNLSEPTDLSPYFDGTHWGTLTQLQGTLNAAGTVFTVDGSGLNSGVVSPITLNLAALAASANVRAVMVQRTFDIAVHQGGKNGPVIYSYGNLTTATSGPNSLTSALATNPDDRYDQITSPVACTFAEAITGENIRTALYDMFDDDAMQPSGITVEGVRYLIELTNGHDGLEPTDADYAGSLDELNGNSGLAAFEDIEDISIVLTPAASASATHHQAIVTEVQKHCRKMRYRVGIVDARKDMAISEIRDFRSQFDDSRLAIYYPWVVIGDPRRKLPDITVPPSGFIAGVYASTDVLRGVHKPPANEIVPGALGFAQDINQFKQELLNPEGINCLRSFAGRGHRVWGGRTLSSDPEWKYINVRRYFLYLERSIEKSTQWAVFEPNGERLWDNVRITVENFLYNEWVNGRLLGSAKTAYFVRCDRSTMTQNDIDNGRLICEIGVAALQPAEFVIFRIGQKTSDA
jgi:phage tail sheath protein FI